MDIVLVLLPSQVTGNVNAQDLGRCDSFHLFARYREQWYPTDEGPSWEGYRYLLVFVSATSSCILFCRDHSSVSFTMVWKSELLAETLQCSHREGVSPLWNNLRLHCNSFTFNTTTLSLQFVGNISLLSYTEYLMQRININGKSPLVTIKLENLYSICPVSPWWDTHTHRDRQTDVGRQTVTENGRG